jgi:phage-related protein
LASEIAELFVVLKSQHGAFVKGMAESSAAGESFSKRAGNALASVGKVTTVAGVGVAAMSVKMAGDFQASMLRLKTSAAETGDLIGGKLTGNLKLVSQGVLKMAVDTATSTKELSSGMYMIESAGFHGAAGLQVLRAAAEGAKAEGADLGTVGNALTTMMKDYHLQASQSVPAMNQLIATVAHGKTTMQDLAGALHSVLPIAAAAKLSYAEVGGAISTMTSHGVTAELATQHLANFIRNLQAPSNVAAKEMGLLGLSAVDVSQHLGQRGLTGTLDMVMQAILRHQKGGLILLSAFNQSKDAASSAKQMFDTMPPSLQKLATAYEQGKISVGDWRGAVKGLPTDQANLAAQFASSINRSHGFTDALKNNRGAAETVSSALKKVTGGAVGLETALQLTGENAKDFNANVKAIGDSAQQGGKHVENWAQIQQSFNFKMQQFHQVAETVGIKIGTKLIPPLTSAATWLSKNQWAAQALAVVIGGVLAASVVAFAAKTVISAAQGIAAFGKLGVSAVQAGASVAKAIPSVSSGGISAVASGWETVRLKAMYAGDAFKTAATKMAGVAKAAGSGIATAAQLAAGWTKAGLAAAAAGVKTVAVAVAQGVVKAATIAWTAVQWLLDAALNANPISLIIIAIAALVAGVIYAYTHFKWFRDIVNAVWRDIKKWFMDGVHAVGAALSWFGRLPGMFGRWLSSAASAVGRGITSVLGFFQRLPGNILRGLGNIGSLLWNTGKNLVIGLWNGLVSMGSWLWNQVWGWIKSVIPGPILRVLGINSPSKLMHGYGQFVAMGLANGIKSQYAAVQDAADGMAGIVAGITQAPVGQVGSVLAGGVPGGSVRGGAVLGGAAPRGVLGAGGAGATVVNNVTHVHVAGSVLSEHELMAVVQKHSLKRNRRNPTNGLSSVAGF